MDATKLAEVMADPKMEAELTAAVDAMVASKETDAARSDRFAAMFAKGAEPVSYIRHVDPDTGSTTVWMSEEVASLLPLIDGIKGFEVVEARNGDMTTFTIRADAKSAAVEELGQKLITEGTQYDDSSKQDPAQDPERVW